MSGPKINTTPVAKSVPFDNSINGFDATNTQAAIEEIGASASPGFSWSRSGSLLASTWLQNDGINSNIVGRYVPVDNPVIAKVFISSQNVNTFTVTIYQHDGNSVNLTSLASYTITSARGGIFTPNLSITAGKQLAIRITSGTASNILVGIIVKGSGV